MNNEIMATTSLRPLLRGLVLLQFVAWGVFASAQTPPCGTDVYMQRNAHALERMEASYRDAFAGQQGGQRRDDVKVIPVVVHVIHNGGTENISDAQVISQLQVINEDYGKLPGTNGDGAGVDTHLRFCLAQIGPSGECTNGIVRVKTPLTNHQSYQRTMLKQVSGWDPARYLNIYVVHNIDNGSGTLGYSSFPGGPPDEDGFVVRYNAFGLNGTAVAPNNLGRTATHELGHWLGMYHTFQDGCGTDPCTTGDLVCDTPPVAAPHFGCPANANTCANDVPDLNDLVDNFMDYTNDACKSMFTLGQSDRAHGMLQTLRFDIWQAANTTATGCDSSFVAPPCSAVAAFTTLVQQVCTGNPVQYVSTALNDPIAWQWYFPGGSPSSSTEEDPVVTYNMPGVYDVALVATNALGSDSLMSTSLVTVSDPVPGQLPPFSEGFESLVFPPNGITIDNPDGGNTWVLDTVAVQAEGIASAHIDNLTYTNYGQSDALVLPAFDLANFGSMPYLRFRWAYARSDASYSDQLVVLVSTDCGVNFTQVWARSGISLTTGPTQTTPYIPDSTTNWKSANINLSAYVGSDHAIIRLVNVTDGGNYLYVDNINLGDQFVGIAEAKDVQGQLSVYPMPVTDAFTVAFTLLSSGNTSIRIIDALGRISFVQELGRMPIGEHRVTLDRASLGATGVYTLLLETANERRSAPIILK